MPTHHCPTWRSAFQVSWYIANKEELIEPHDDFMNYKFGPHSKLVLGDNSNKTQHLLVDEQKECIGVVGISTMVSEMITECAFVIII